MRFIRVVRIGRVAVVLALFASGCGYNAVVAQDEAVKAAWAEVQSQYQRRADLVPNLVATVKGSANFEQTTLTQVVEARAKATSIKIDASTIDDPAKLQQFEQAQAGLSSALGRLIAVSESYPDLKASAAFRDLMTQLEGTENRITVARGRYIQAVADYNITVQSFPTSCGAKMRNMAVRPTFTATTTGAETAPQVKF